jgi:hypothetical protein
MMTRYRDNTGGYTSPTLGLSESNLRKKKTLPGPSTLASIAFVESIDNLSGFLGIEVKTSDGTD